MRPLFDISSSQRETDSRWLKHATSSIRKLLIADILRNIVIDFRFPAIAAYRLALLAGTNSITSLDAALCSKRLDINIDNLPFWDPK